MVPGAAGGAAGGLSPQMLQMLMARMQAMQPPQQGTMQPSSAGPMAIPPPQGASTPMANYIGAGGGGVPMQRPPMPMPQQPPGMAGSPAAAAAPQGGSGMLNPQMMQMLQMLKGQQTGVTPGGGAQPAPPSQMAPGMGGGTGPLAPWLDQLLRSGGAYGGITGGAPT